MSVSIETVQSLNSFFKPTWADKVADLIPEHEMLLSSIPFVPTANRAGAEFVTPVMLSRAHGISYHGVDGQITALNPAIGAINDQASVKPSAMSIRGQLAQVAIARAKSGPQAFITATSYLVESLTESFAAALEQTHWYGQSGLGVVSATASSGGLTFTDGVETSVVAILVNAADWAEGVWVGGENMPIEIYNGASLVSRHNVTSVDITNRILYVDSLNGQTNLAGYTIFRKGAKSHEFAGMQKILSNTGSLFNIDASVRRLWAATQPASLAGYLTFPGVTNGYALAYGRGLMGSSTLYVNPFTFQTLFPTFDTLKTDSTSNRGRQFKDSAEVKNLEHGTNSVKFFINNVEVSVVATSYMKRGYAFGVNPENFKRIGSTPMTFNMPGEDEGKYFHRLQDDLAVELRAFADEGLFCDKPANQIYFSGITST